MPVYTAAPHCSEPRSWQSHRGLRSRPLRRKFPKKWCFSSACTRTSAWQLSVSCYLNQTPARRDRKHFIQYSASHSGARAVELSKCLGTWLTVVRGKDTMKGVMWKRMRMSSEKFCVQWIEITAGIHSWSKCRGQLTVTCPTPADTPTRQPLHLRLR